MSKRNKKEITVIDHTFLESVSDVLLQARKNVKTAVNLTMVYAYYEIGRIIVEEEQRGEQHMDSSCCRRNLANG